MKQSDGQITIDMFDDEHGYLEAPPVDWLALEVFNWAEATFPDRTDASMYLKLYSEVGELIRSEGEALELADIFILLMDYAVRKKISIGGSVRQKLEINRQRTWKISADGTMSHEE